MRQLESGAWVLEVLVTEPGADLLLAPIGSPISLALSAETAQAAHAAKEQSGEPAQVIGGAGAGDSFELGGGRALSATEQAALRYIMALVAMPPFQLFAAQQMGVVEPPDAQAIAQDYVQRACPKDLLSDRGIETIRGLHAQFKAWWAANFRHELTFHAECP